MPSTPEIRARASARAVHSAMKKETPSGCQPKNCISVERDDGGLVLFLRARKVTNKRGVRSHRLRHECAILALFLIKAVLQASPLPSTPLSHPSAGIGGATKALARRPHCIPQPRVRTTALRCRCRQ
eukprot:TRINITY_DN4920_c0_g3_i1.p2 TRINITY_DN4920_c0_g3~~TRINITY_DN4920_c0_g3_i1.p2  ORF type:complete len:127 (+),score=12.13 TRINITY_DN4920_c0_g3_i1:188-568(+)